MATMTLPGIVYVGGYAEAFFDPANWMSATVQIRASGAEAFQVWTYPAGTGVPELSPRIDQSVGLRPNQYEDDVTVLGSAWSFTKYGGYVIGSIITDSFQDFRFLYDASTAFTPNSPAFAAMSAGGASRALDEALRDEGDDPIPMPFSSFGGATILLDESLKGTDADDTILGGGAP